ncbi:MAG: MFS transporter [Arachnia sp.]
MAKTRMFASFGIPNYRLFFIGALVSNLGTWIQRIGQDWLVLTDLTHGSSTALGIVTALQFLAVPFLAPYAGAVVDRYAKRRVLLITQLALGLTSLALWALIATGTVALWHVYAIAFLTGVISAFDNPARQAFVSEMVPTELLPNAVGLNSTSFNGARLIGPGVAGLLVAGVGVGPTQLINAVSFAAMMAAILAMNPAQLRPAPRVTSSGAAVDGIRYLKGRPDLVVLLAIVFMLGTFGMNFQIFNATMATEVFGKGAEEFGLLGTIMAIGTLAGALQAARRAKPTLRTILLALTGFAVSTLALTFAPNYVVYSLLLIPSGFFSLTVMTSANAAVQLGSAPEYRGRVMSIYTAIFIGGTPLGAPAIGWLGETLGPRASVLVASVATALTVLGVLIYFRKHNGLRVHLERAPFRLVATTEPHDAQAKAA